MKILLSILLLLSSLVIWGLNSKEAKRSDVAVDKEMPSQLVRSMTDSRDGETYATTKIGEQIWMAENLRYNAPGSILNPDNPSVVYGRIYDGVTAQTVCPSAWHLPTDAEWSEMEMALGMSPADTAQTFWRGEHGTKMKSTTGWWDGKNGTNSSGFNGFPAGYFFLAAEGDEDELGGLGSSGGYWSAAEGNKAWVRFLGGPLTGVNRFEDVKLGGFSLACRCVKD